MTEVSVGFGDVEVGCRYFVFTPGCNSLGRCNVGLGLPPRYLHFTTGRLLYSFINTTSILEIPEDIETVFYVF